MSLILIPLQKAVASLELALQQPKNEFIRDAVIQRFENTYELCWKMLRRKLIEDQGEASVALLSRRELFRMGAEYGFIGDSQRWITYHRARNETSHLYDEKKAEEVYLVAVDFLPSAQALLDSLERRNDE
ncbi:nucleotidyltransferase [Marinobacterium nitratireducens]|uniref:Nucleotidyltransferase n=1 Tax=Marinobacterium nitratireducens TaxID=518897 RepID=A0A918DW76_9GAMM|nr:nucleotidyltransferase substrate binding protein [Marinobacterium nitratireducens]GGO85187.1 nucleotidyltransferase [Marinobacterium nitratireducens]